MGSLWESIRDLCCCKGAGGDDDFYQGLIRNEELDRDRGTHPNAAAAVAPGGGRHLNNGSTVVGGTAMPTTGGGGVGSGGGSAYGGAGPNGRVPSAQSGYGANSQTQQARTQDQEEEEALNRILDRTQQRIIDISNLESSVLDIDVVQRARLYSEAIRKHDAVVEKRRQALGVGGGGGGIGQMSPMQQQQPLPTTTQSSKIARLFTEDYAPPASIECKEELISFMSLSMED